MLNDPFVVDQATKWGAAVAALPDADEPRIRTMLLTALSRPPESDETAALLLHLAAVRSAQATASSAG